MYIILLVLFFNAGVLPATTSSRRSSGKSKTATTTSNLPDLNLSLQQQQDSSSTDIDQHNTISTSFLQRNRHRRTARTINLSDLESFTTDINTNSLYTISEPESDFNIVCRHGGNDNLPNDKTSDLTEAAGSKSVVTNGKYRTLIPEYYGFAKNRTLYGDGPNWIMKLRIMGFEERKNTDNVTEAQNMTKIELYLR